MKGLFLIFSKKLGTVVILFFMDDNTPLVNEFFLGIVQWRATSGCPSIVASGLSILQTPLPFFKELFLWHTKKLKGYIVTICCDKSQYIDIIYEVKLDTIKSDFILKTLSIYIYMFIFNDKMLLNIILIYLMVINIATFIIRWVDKWKSIKHKRRISEKELLIFSALWWFVGAIIGMTIRHHKTIKWKFLRKFWLIVFAWIFALSMIYYFLYR